MSKSNRCVLPSMSVKNGMVCITQDAAILFQYLLEKEHQTVCLRLRQLKENKLDNPRNTLLDVGLKTNKETHDEILVYLEELNRYVTS